jgi:uncharacterized protein YndB with AHSA1/START domain
MPTNQENNFKVRIDAYTSDPTASGGGGAGAKNWEATINPQAIKRDFEVKFNSDYSANNTTRYVKQYHGQGEELLTFNFTIDGSYKGSDSSDRSTADGNSPGVYQHLEKFKDIVYGYDGSIHKIPWLKVTLGKEEGFFCHLKNMDIEYTKYTPDGDPQRAKVNVTFTFHTNQKNLAAAANRQSPDMSHLINIKDGDRLTLICDKIYSDFGYYTDIAKANNLTNFRNLQPGTRLVFPPLSS